MTDARLESGVITRDRVPCCPRHCGRRLVLGVAVQVEPRGVRAAVPPRLDSQQELGVHELRAAVVQQHAC